MEMESYQGEVVLSVVIPTKNRLEFVQRPIRTFAEFAGAVEVFVVDDGSEEACAEAVRAVCQESANCAYVRGSGAGGAAAARNVGFGLSRARYVWFFDDDDIVCTDTIARVLQRVRGTPRNDDVILLPMSVQYNSRELYRVEPSTTAPSFEWHRTRGNIVNTSCAVFSRAVVTTAGGWDEKLSGGDDTDLFLRCSKFCKFFCLEATAVRVNIGHRQRFSSNLVKQQRAKIQCVRKHWNDLSVGCKLRYFISFLVCGPLLQAVFFHRLRHALRHRF